MSGSGSTVSEGTLSLGGSSSNAEVLDVRTLDNAGSASWGGNSGSFTEQYGANFTNETGAPPLPSRTA